MPADEIDLLAIERGTVTAPAGCGKTHLIADAITRHTDAKPILVLTHTNAGVVALRGRLDRAGVPSKAYRLSTIDGWAMRLISTFPTRSNHNPEIIKLVNPAVDYPNIRVAAVNLLKAGHVSDILAASYARLIVDEYQDCSIRQHGIVGYAAQTLQTCVLGDPMQAIFGFGNDNLAKWEEHVCAYFPLAGELTTPWRWINADAEPLGRWLLEVRGRLLRGESIDLRAAPAAVSWVQLDGTEDHQRRLAAARVRPPHNDGRVLIIGDSKNPESQRQFESQTHAAITVEALDLKDLV
jgi:DNA helicase-2/ATP-dependent DNA helicase PcrA